MFRCARYMRNPRLYQVNRYNFATRSESRDKLFQQSARYNSRLIPGAATVAAGIALVRDNPFTSQVLIATAKTSLADLVVQKQVERRDEIDWRRNALFVVFGCLYLGVFQWYVYVVGFQRLFPAMTEFCNQSVRLKLKNKAGIRQLFAQIGMDFVFIQPFIFFPTFYTFKTIVDRKQYSSIDERFSQVYSTWKANFIKDNVGMCAFWFPMDLIVYSVPVWSRLPVNHSISFIWVCILSFFRGHYEE